MGSWATAQNRDLEANAPIHHGWANHFVEAVTRGAEG